MLEDALGDTAELDVSMVGRHLAKHRLSIPRTSVMQVLIAGTPLDGIHVHHPEMVGVGTQGVDRMFEAEFDLETKSVEADDGKRIHIRIGTHDNDASSSWMDHKDETYQCAGRLP